MNIQNFIPGTRTAAIIIFFAAVLIFLLNQIISKNL